MVNMPDIELLKKGYNQYILDKSKYQKMLNYYNEQNDIITKYKKIENRSNEVVINNYIPTFINLEVNYTVSKPLNYTSKSGNKEIIEVINNELSHLSYNYNVDLLRNVEIFGKCYEVYNIVNKKFTPVLISPLSGYVHKDKYNNIEFFMHVYRLEFSEIVYVDVYTKSGVKHYNNKFECEIADEELYYYGGEIPVVECVINKTVYQKIKNYVDNLDQILSDQTNILADMRNNFLVFSGGEFEDIDPEKAVDMKRSNVMVLPSGATVQWLTTDIPDQHIQNMVNTYQQRIYEITGHVNLSEKLQANTSGQAIQNRLFGLSQRCSELGNCIIDCVKERIRFLCIYLDKRNKTYDYSDIDIKTTLNLPVDLITIGQYISQADVKVSEESKISLLPFDPQIEYAKYKDEQSENETLLGEQLLNKAGVDDGEE